MKAKVLSDLFLIFYSPVYFAQSSSGIIKGKVSDADTKKTLIGVHVIVSGLSIGTVTDYNGEFEISGLEAGIYVIEFRFLGYGRYIQSDVVVRNHRPTVLDIELK